MSLPASHANPEAMARCLVTYLSCDYRVHREVRGEFMCSQIELSTIAAIRRARNAPQPRGEAFKPHEGYYPGDASDALTRANNLHVSAIMMERRRALFEAAA